MSVIITRRDRTVEGPVVALTGGAARALLPISLFMVTGLRACASCVILAASIFSSCASNKVPLPPGPIGETHTTSAPLREGDAGPPAAGLQVFVRITSSLREACELGEPVLEPSAYLVEGVDLVPRVVDVLGGVSACLRGEEHTQQRLCVTQFVYADERQVQGESGGRARAVRRYLEKVGLDPSRVDVAVRNEDLVVRGGSRSVEHPVEVALEDSAACPGRI